MVLPGLAGTPWRWLTLSTAHDIVCLVDAEDYETWISLRAWNYGWHRSTPWKYYAKRNVGRERSTIYLHREVLVHALPEDAELAADHHGDHINGQSLDNRRANLRWLTPAQNTRNRIARSRVPSLQHLARQLLQGCEEVPFDR